MDIEIKNEAQALSLCENGKNQTIKQLNNHISNLKMLINKIGNEWSSTGLDKESYFVELNKQADNLSTISDISFRFFDVIYRYITNVEKTASNTISGGSAGGGSVSNGAVQAAANSAQQIADQMAGYVGSSGSSSSGVGKGSSYGNSSSSYGGSGSSSYGNSGSYGSGISSTGGNSGSSYVGGGSSSYGGGGSSSYVGNVGSSYGSGSSSSGVSSFHGTGAGSSVKSLTTAGVNGKSNQVANTSGVNKVAGLGNIDVSGTSDSITTSASKIFTNNKLNGLVPKLSVPVTSGSASSSKAVPVISGSVAAGAVGIGAAAVLKKGATSKMTDKLEIDDWNESTEPVISNEALTMEEKLDELTFEDSII